MARLDSSGGGGDGGGEEEEDTQPRPRKPAGPGPDAGGGGAAEPDDSDRGENDAGDTEPRGPAGGGPTDRTGGTGTAEPEPEPGTAPTPEPETTARTQAIRERTARANQSASLSTTGVGTTGTRRSRIRERTPRASESRNLGTTTVGTTGTRRTRARRRTPRANQSVSLSTTGVGTDLTATEEAERRRSEEFGDYELVLGGQTDDTRTRIGTRLATNEANPAAPETDTGAVTFEKAARDLSGSYRSRVSQSFESGLLSDPITDDVVGIFASEETADRAGEAVSTTAEAGVQSLNPFQAAIGVKEITEFGGEAVKETAEGDLGVNITVDDGIGVETTEQGFAGRAGRRAGQVVGAAVEEAQEDPLKAGAMLTGSLLGTGAALGAASRAGRVSGTAARYTIQPGEEIAGSVGYRATRAATSARTADRLFPDGELLVSEEGAIRAARATRSRVGDFRPKQFRARPTPRQAELVRRFGPGAGGRGTLDEFGVPERARSTVPPRSKLGSDTESILDATTSVDVEANPGPTSTVRAESESELATEGDRGESNPLPLYSEIQEAGGVRPYIRDEDLPGARPILASEIENFRELFGDERAQASLVGRSRVRQRDPEPSEFDQRKVAGELQRQQLAQRRQLAGDYEGELQPFRTRTFEAERPRDRTRAGVESDVSTRTPAETFFPQEDVMGEEDVFAGQQPADATSEFEGVGTPARVGVTGRPDTVADIRLDTRTRLDQQQDFETELETEFRLRAAQASQFEQETETRARSAFESRTRVRAESDQADGGDGFDEFGSNFGFGGGEGAGGVLVPGWLEETATDIATRGFSGDISPSQQALESEAAVERATGSLPTRQFFGDEQTREDIEEAQAFLTFGAVGEPDGDAEPFFGGEL